MQNSSAINPPIEGPITASNDITPKWSSSSFCDTSISLKDIEGKLNL